MLTIIKQRARRKLIQHNNLLRVYSILTKHKISFAANHLDLLIEKLSPNPGFYVELGANDGVSQSQTKYLEVYSGWHGVLIEPTPEIYKILKRNRSKRNYFENSACVSFEFPHAQIPMLYSDLMTISLSGENVITNRQLHAKEGLRHLLRGKKNYEFLAPAITLNEILILSEAPSVIDFLSLDVEGSEFEVLRGIDFKQFRFEVILIETRSIREIERFLNSNGYLMIGQVSKLDYLFSSAPWMQHQDQKLVVDEFLGKQFKKLS